MDTRLKNVNIQLASLVHYLEFFWSRFFFFFFDFIQLNRIPYEKLHETDGDRWNLLRFVAF